MLAMDGELLITRRHLPDFLGFHGISRNCFEFLIASFLSFFDKRATAPAQGMKLSVSGQRVVSDWGLKRNAYSLTKKKTECICVAVR